MLLKKIIKSCPNNISNYDISGLSLDSRKVKKGDIFFSLENKKNKYQNFINEAIKKGAKVIVVSKKNKYKNFF